MSKQGRIGLIVAALVVIVVAFVVFAPGDDTSDDSASTTPTTPAQTPTATTPGTTATTQAPPPPPAPSFKTIQVKGGQPVGGIKTVTVDKGDRVRIQVTSPDTTEEIHLHGYDIARDLKAGGRVRFSFDAGIEGIFEIELEHSGTQIGKLVVEP